LAVATLSSLAIFFPGASASGQSAPAHVSTTSNPTKNCGTVNLKGVTPVADTGNPFHSNNAYLKCSHGQIIQYGDNAITYANPPASYVSAGALLFAQTCSSCHGSRATDVKAVEAERKATRLTPQQALELAAYVNSLDPAVPAVPTPNLNGADLAAGADLFSLNCAACHTITGAGDALAFGTNAPSLQNREVTPQQVAEAMRIGPANMPRFTGNLTDAQVRDVVAYVTEKIQHPASPGGAGLGGVGPVAEGFVALLLGVGGLALICFWIGERS
jgi:ubiquinol-cytochrome c reductase cytochrome c subunit